MRFNGKPCWNLHICKERALGVIAGGFFFWVDLFLYLATTILSQVAPKRHPIKWTEPAKLYGKPVLLVEMRRIELLCVCLPIDKKSMK